MLDPTALVIGIQRGGHGLRNHAGAKATWGRGKHLALENQLHLVRATKVQVLADHFLEEKVPARKGIE